MSIENKIKIPLLTAEDVEIKIKQVTKSGALALLYKTARTDRKYLNLIYGPMNWTSDYKVIKDNLYCGIGVREDSEHDFVWKWDCGIESRSDDEGNEKKGEASDAFKRAGFQWGIGEELYSSPVIWLNVDTKQNASQKWELANRYAKYVITDYQCNDEKRIITKLTIANEDTGVVVYSWEMPSLETEEEPVVVPNPPKKAAPVVEPVKEVAAEPTPVEATDFVHETTEHIPLTVLISNIGKIAKAIKTNTGSLDQYNNIVHTVSGGDTFRCNTATEEQYNIVLGIYTELKKLGYQI